MDEKRDVDVDIFYILLSAVTKGELESDICGGLTGFSLPPKAGVTWAAAVAGVPQAVPPPAFAPRAPPEHTTARQVRAGQVGGRRTRRA